MSNRIRILAALLSTVLLTSAVPATAGAGVHSTAPGTTSQARVGFGRSSRAPSYRPRSRARLPYGRRYRRPGYGRGLFGGILRALGIAYLFHALFGWGAGGGSPFGLLLLAAILLFLATRRPRRVTYW